MKKLLILSIFMMFSSALFAQATEPGTLADAPMMQGMEQMQARMQAMRAKMAQIQATEDPEERQRLMREHMQSMHESMTMMSEMMGGAMAQGQMEQCQQGDGECRMDQMEKQQQMMGQRMGMMQEIMQQMLERTIPGQASESAEGENHEEHH